MKLNKLKKAVRSYASETDEWEDSYLRIRWHALPIEESYYEMELFATARIRYLHRGAVLSERLLTSVEEENVLELTRRLQVAVFHVSVSDELFDKVLPELPFKLSFKTTRISVCLDWTINREPCDPVNSRLIDLLTEEIEAMVELDWEKIGPLHLL